MSALLDAIRAEITPLEARLETLREIERLAGQLDGEATTNEPAEQAKATVPLLPVRETKAKPAAKRTPPARAQGSHQPDGGAPTARIDQGAAAVALRDRVLKAITAKQGDLDDDAIARKLDVPVEEVATAAAQLHAAGRIWALPGGAWALSRKEAA